LGIIFLLNALALFIFPEIGQYFHLSQNQFGIWSAIAIHDTSSVVGAAAKYGNQALEVATTVKLARALWIVPIAFFSSLLFKNKEAKVKIPYFIGLFVLALLINTYVPMVGKISPYIVKISKAGLTLTLFLIGSGLSKSILKSVGVKPVVQGTLLWIAISTVALISIMTL